MTQSAGPDILFFPPLLSLVVPAAAIAAEWVVPLGLLPAAGSGWSIASGLVLILGAGALAAGGTRAFRQAGTHVDPRQSALHLVQDGPYRFTRNPMYLGMVILQLGLGLVFSLDWAVLGAVILWACLHWGVVLREEAYLSHKFGAPYDEYLTQTRRWL